VLPNEPVPPVIKKVLLLNIYTPKLFSSMKAIIVGSPSDHLLKTGGFTIFSLEDITVVILSRGREHELSRSINYWNQTNLNVVILHNTKMPILQSSLAPNISYIVMERDFAARCARAIPEINTRYAVFCADDELLLPSGLSRMGNYLEQHPEISSIGGATLGVGKYGSTLTATYTYQNMIGYSNLHNSYFERLESHSFGQPEYRTGAMYRLMRAEVMTLLLQTFSSLSNISTPYIFEVTGEIVVNGSGKSIYLNELYWVRNWINHQVEHKDWDRKLYFQEWWGAEKYAKEREEWIDLLTPLPKDEDSKKRLLRIVGELNEKRKILETRESNSNSKLRNRIPQWLRRIRRNLTPRKSVKNSIDHFFENQLRQSPQLVAELRRTLTFLD
jgi:glycosyltransferase domain-containing protein